jgi:hypothetical protein
MVVIKTKQVLSSGNLKMTPAPDKAYKPQPVRIEAIINVTIVGYGSPLAAS